MKRLHNFILGGLTAAAFIGVVLGGLNLGMYPNKAVATLAICGAWLVLFAHANIYREIFENAE